MATMPLVTGWQAYRATPWAPRCVSALAHPRALPAPEALPRTCADLASWPRHASARSQPAARPAPSAPGPCALEPWLPMLVAVWLAGVSLLTVRLLGGWMWVQRMKRHGSTAASRELQAMVVRLSKRLHISRSVRLLQSSAVDVPTVIGWLRPVILLPASALAGLSPTQLEAILAHELAHIRRHDYLVNLLQTLLETLLFYHPAVWWLSRRIRDERENCCDDLAVSLCGDPGGLRPRAGATSKNIAASRGPLVMAASGRLLLQRIRRLLAAHRRRTPVAARSGSRARAGARGRHRRDGRDDRPRTEVRPETSRRRAGGSADTEAPPARPIRGCDGHRTAARAPPDPQHLDADAGGDCANSDNCVRGCAECAVRDVRPAACAAGAARAGRTLRTRRRRSRRRARTERTLAPSAPSAPSCAFSPSGPSSSIHTSGSGQKSRGTMSWSQQRRKARGQVRRGVRVQ